MTRKQHAELVDEQGNVVIPELMVADGFISRLRGLIARPPLMPHQALLITPCNSVHTFWMGYPLRLSYLDADGRVICIEEALKPRKLSRCAGAVSVVEQNALSPTFWLTEGERYLIRRKPSQGA